MSRTKHQGKKLVNDKLVRGRGSIFGRGEGPGFVGGKTPRNPRIGQWVTDRSGRKVRYNPVSSARRTDPRTGRYVEKRRTRPGTAALREVKKLQVNSTKLIIPKRRFQLLVKEIAIDRKSDIKFEVSAVQALQEAAEAHLVELFRKAQVVACHAKRETLYGRDLHVVRHITGDTGLLDCPNAGITATDAKFLEQVSADGRQWWKNLQSRAVAWRKSKGIPEEPETPLSRARRLEREWQEQQDVRAARRVLGLDSDGGDDDLDSDGGDDDGGDDDGGGDSDSD